MDWSPSRLKQHPAVVESARWYLRRRTRSVERYCFAATTGRSGTTTLAAICDLVPGCRALHEPGPRMHREVLRAAAAGDTDAVRNCYRDSKSLHILRAAAGARFYVETTHQFAKSFGPYVLDDLAGRCAVVHLVRDPVAVADSIRVSGTQPGTEVGNNWWLDPTGPANLVRVADVLGADARFSDPFFAGLWYWYEIEARIRRLRDRFPTSPS